MNDKKCRSGYCTEGHLLHMMHVNVLTTQKCPSDSVHSSIFGAECDNFWHGCAIRFQVGNLGAKFLKFRSYEIASESIFGPKCNHVPKSSYTRLAKTMLLEGQMTEFSMHIYPSFSTYSTGFNFSIVH